MIGDRRDIRITETSVRVAHVSDQDARDFVIEYLEDEFLLRDVYVKDGRRIWIEEHRGHTCTFEEHDMGPALPTDEPALAVLKTLRSRMK